MAYIYDLTDTWNAGATTFNGIKLNVTDTASAVSSKLVTLQTNGTEHFSVTKAGVGYFNGSLLVGTTSSAFASGGRGVIEVNGSSEVLYGFKTGGTARGYLFHNGTSLFISNDQASGSLILNTVGTERMRIDASGNVGIGTSSPGSLLELSADLGPTINLRRSGSTNGNGVIRSIGSSGTVNAAITFGGGVSNLMSFDVNGSERMRIDSSGNLLVGTTVTGISNSNSITLEGLGGAQVINHSSSSPSGSYYVIFGHNTGLAGSITQNGTTAVLYNTSSDVRLKHDIIDAPEASSLIDAIQVRSFKWNADNSEQRYGFIAQELVEVAPEAVSQPVDPDDMMGVDYSKLVPMLVKELQSLRARVAQLEGAA